MTDRGVRAKSTRGATWRRASATVTGPDGAPVLRVRAGPPSRQGFARFEKTFMALATLKLYRNNQPLQSVEVRNMFNAITLDLSNQA